MRIVCVQAGSITFHIESQHKKACICDLSHRKRKRKRKKKDRMYKTKVQELCHKKQWGLPMYSAIKYGPDHNPRFKASISINGLSFHSPFPPNPPKMPKTTLPDSLSSTSPLLNRFMVLTRQVNFLN